MTSLTMQWRNWQLDEYAHITHYLQVGRVDARRRARSERALRRGDREAEVVEL